MGTMDKVDKAYENRGKPLRVFDWDKAAELIREASPMEASAGLGTDWFSTGGPIYQDGYPVKEEDTYTYLASNWAIPELDMDGVVQPCWQWQDDTPGWGSNTYWPESSLKILEG